MYVKVVTILHAKVTLSSEIYAYEISPPLAT